MQFREHRGTLPDSIKTMVELKDRAALALHCRSLLIGMGCKVPEPMSMQLKLYSNSPDERFGWERTYIVTVGGMGVLGFTNSNE